MLQDNQQTVTPVGKSQKINWILCIAFSTLFLIFAFFWGHENIFLWLRGLNAVNPKNEFILISIVSVIRPLAVVGAFVFISKQMKTPATLCATVSVVISSLMTIGIVFYMRYPHTQLPFFAWIAYGLDLLASLLFLVFSLGKTQKYNKILSTIIFIFGILSVLFSVLLSLFVYPDGSFEGSRFWEYGGIQFVFFSNRETLVRMMGCATIFWPIGQCFYFFALFAGMRNGCTYPVKAPKTTAQNYGGSDGYISLGKHVVLLFFTFGIWYLIWIYRTTAYLNRTPNAEPYNPTSKLLLCMFIPFYSIYWYYKHGQRIDTLSRSKNLNNSDMATICLILGIFIPIVACILMQDRINTIAQQAN